MSSPRSKKKSAALVRMHGWTQAFADGYVDGEAWRRRGKHPSNLVLVSRDDYSLGFRAGYFERGEPRDLGPDAHDEPRELGPDASGGTSET